MQEIARLAWIAAIGAGVILIILLLPLVIYGMGWFLA